MSNRKTTMLIIALLVLLVGGAVYAFKQAFEQKERIVRTGFLSEARTNPLFASRLFLKRMGIPTVTQQSINGLNGLPNTDTVILINSKRSSISPKQNDKLIEWVKSGGHVIALASHNWRYYRSDADLKKDSAETSYINEVSDIDVKHRYTTDPLQSFLGVTTESRVTYGDLTETEQELIDDIDLKDGDYTEDTVLKVKLNDIDDTFAIMNMWFNPLALTNNRKPFPDEPELITLRSEQFMLRQKVGIGLITLVSSLDFIENRHLDQADHAEILWYLIHGLHKPIHQPEAVWLIHNDKVSPLWKILWQTAWAFILALCTLLIAWFLYKTRRFGPVIPKQDSNRRSLNEHINSSGNYYWKYDKEKLLQSTQTALHQTLSSRYPNWAHLDQVEQLTLLLDTYKESKLLDEQRLNKALFSKRIDDTDEFTRAIKLMEFIRKNN